MKGTAETAGRPVTTMPLVRVQEHGRKGGVDVLACGHTLQVSPFGNYSRSRRCPMCPARSVEPTGYRIQRSQLTSRLSAALGRQAAFIDRLIDALEGEHGGGDDNRHPGCATCSLIEAGRRHTYESR